jgi:hypothetical protein
MDPELLALAFCVITETNLESEMPFIAGCILNRVRNKYRGSTVREVVLADWQYSAFGSDSHPSPQRLALKAADPDVAVAVYLANRGESSQRLFEESVVVCGDVLSNEDLNNPWINGQVEHVGAPRVHHYYSPISMKPPGSAPNWWRDDREVLVPEISSRRFRFAWGIA